MTDPTSLIDHTRYSLAEPSSPKTVALIERCRTELAERRFVWLRGC